jgi:hypothetical protein
MGVDWRQMYKRLQLSTAEKEAVAGRVVTGGSGGGGGDESDLVRDAQVDEWRRSSFPANPLITLHRPSPMASIQGVMEKGEVYHFAWLSRLAQSTAAKARSSVTLHGANAGTV